MKRIGIGLCFVFVSVFDLCNGSFVFDLLPSSLLCFLLFVIHRSFLVATIVMVLFFIGFCCTTSHNLVNFYIFKQFRNKSFLTGGSSACKKKETVYEQMSELSLSLIDFSSLTLCPESAELYIKPKIHQASYLFCMTCVLHCSQLNNVIMTCVCVCVCVCVCICVCIFVCVILFSVILKH